jgi:hypothetical protein
MRPTESPEDGLARLLGLEPIERSWLLALSPVERRSLHSALLSPTERPTRHTVDLIMKVVGRRERLFPYVGYPPLPNRLSACDGLLRE